MDKYLATQIHLTGIVLVSRINKVSLIDWSQPNSVL